MSAQGPGFYLSIISARTQHPVPECDGNDRTTHAPVHQPSWPRPPQSLHSGPPFRTLFHSAIGAPLLSFFPPLPLPPAPLLSLSYPARRWEEAPPRLCPGSLKLDSRRARDTARQRAVRHRSDLPISPALSVISTASPGANPSTLIAHQPIHPIHRRPGPPVPMSPWSPALP